MKLVDRYFDLAVQPDLDAYYAQFAEDALVEDEGRERRGVAAIRQWRTEVPPVTYSVVESPRTARATTRTRTSRATSRAARCV